MIAKTKDSSKKERITWAPLSFGLIALGAFLWMTSLLRSVYDYRSPLHQQPPQASERLGDPLTHRLVFVLIDGLRLDTSLQPDIMPTLNALRQSGAWAVMHSQPPSYSQPAYTVLMTGASPELSDGPVLNLDYTHIRTWTQDNLFSAVHRARMKTAVAGYYWFEKLIPTEAVDAYFYTPGEDREADEQVVQAALPWLLNEDYSFILIHLDQVDYAGHHEGGPVDERWRTAAQRADHLLQEIVNALDLTRDTLVVCSDHGHIDRGGHGGHERVVLRQPFVMIGAGAKPGVYSDIEMIDVAPTLAALLGVNLPASSQGSVLTNMLALSQQALFKIQEAQAQQQAALIQAYRSALGYDAIPSSSTNDKTSTLEGIRSSRMNAERLPRALLALCILALGVWHLQRSGARQFFRLSIGALVYLALFNFGYLIMGRYGYSWSTLGNPTMFLFALMIMSLLSYAIALFTTKLLNKRVSQFSGSLWKDHVRNQTYAILLLLSLPVLGYYTLYGAWVTWMLPDFTLLFLALISLVQIVILAALGLLISLIIPRWIH